MKPILPRVAEHFKLGAVIIEDDIGSRTQIQKRAAVIYVSEIHFEDVTTWEGKI